jgi:hypothetical protein
VKPYAVIASEAKQSSAREARKQKARHQRQAPRIFLRACRRASWIASLRSQ